MTYKYISFSIAITFISFLVGMAINSFLKNTDYYNKKLSSLNFIKDDKINEWMGVGIVKWIILNTPFKYLNQKLKLRSRVDRGQLMVLRDEMTSSEIDHLIGFLFVSFFALQKIFTGEFLFGITITLVNLLMNLYPSLLQQQNKRRIDGILRR